MTWDRKVRQEAILKERIAVIVQHHLSDPRLGFVTITGAELSRDKKRCKVRYTVLGEEQQRRTSSRALADAVPRIQEILAPRLEMRTMPALTFVYDVGVEKESRILDLIEALESERTLRDPDDGDDGGDGDEADHAGGAQRGGPDDDAADVPEAARGEDGPTGRPPDAPG